MLRFWSWAVLRRDAVMLMASFAGAMLMRIAPGFSSDDQELNSGLSAQSIQAIRRAHLADANIPRFLCAYLASLVRGDLGTSRSLNQPVKDLLRERLPITLVNLSFALAVGWLLGLALAIAAQALGHPRLEFSCQWVERNILFPLLRLRWRWSSCCYDGRRLLRPHCWYFLRSIATPKTSCSKAATCRMSLRHGQKAQDPGGCWRGTLRRLRSRS